MRLRCWVAPADLARAVDALERAGVHVEVETAALAVAGDGAGRAAVRWTAPALLLGVPVPAEATVLAALADATERVEDALGAEGTTGELEFLEVERDAS